MRYYIGIDPSTSKTGYAVFNEDGELTTKGAIPAKADDPKAFQFLYNEIVNLLNEYKPKAIICEQQYSGVNANTTIKLIRPTGVILAAVGALSEDVSFQFLAPSSWRKIYHTGTEYEKKYNKRNSFAVTKVLFPGAVTSFNKDNDISDAIGIAFACHSLYREEI